MIARTSEEALVGPYVAVFLNGYGSNEDDLAGLAPLTVPGLPWVCFRAPLVIGPSSYAWFEILTPGNPPPEPLAVAADGIWSWVDEHLDPSTRLVAIGFSQGGLMASELLRTRPERIAATVILGGFVQAAEHPGDTVLAQTQPAVFWGRGADDRVIAPAAVERTDAWLPTHSTLTRRVYPGLAHGVDAREAKDVREFVAQHTGAFTSST